MSKKTLFLILLALVFISFPFGYASAQLHSYGPDISFKNVVDAVVSGIWIFFVGIAVVMFVVSGILFLTAQGDPAKLQIARSSVYWGLAGIVVAIVAYSIITIVGNLLK